MITNRVLRFRGKDSEGIWHTAQIGQDYIQFYGSVVAFNSVGIVPSTVGQGTGCVDSQGNEIFEGDIIHLQGKKYVAFENGAFRVVPCDAVQRRNWEHSILRQSDLRYWIVVGNLYDTPELVEDLENG